MPENPIVADHLGQFSARVGGGIYKMLAATLLFVLAVFFIEDPFHDSLLFGASIGLLSLFIVLKAAAFHFRRVAERLQDHSSEIIDQDPLATIVADLSGEIVLVNPAAFDLLGARPGSSVLRALLGVFDNPAPLIFSLANQGETERCGARGCDQPPRSRRDLGASLRPQRSTRLALVFVDRTDCNRGRPRNGFALLDRG
ncbi:hypothetical protein [Brevirhabdus sp.]|uniref:hypothetical protein n=1 Tax=Brevirhabdus sp. TaxID=2004514 RepID=UPI00405A0066